MGETYDNPSEWAAKLKEIFDALVERGFTPEQAIKLMVGAFNGGK